ncbi:hypothetical protein Leryth_001601 [Lithospermum erythrorhizon]|nr:hypothetical protein Leryth_001601 [Lithospermum erythrorhizon]
MFGKSKFCKKCTLATKLTIRRLELIKKKRNAMQRYLKNDIVDLLKNGLDKNAYDRAEGFLVEQNLTYCYEFVEKFIGQILNNVPVMDKQGECPEDCREAVSSLIFAAARFADLPDLRDLRSIFTERYGTSLDSYANKEFVDRLKLTHPTKDIKLQLLQDIAEESGVQWNRNDAEGKLFKHLPQGTEHSSPQKNKEHRTPFRDIPQGGRKQVAKENVDDNEILQDKAIPPPPYRRSYVDQTRKDDKGLGVADFHNRDERDNKIPKPVSVRRTRSKLMYNEDDVGVSSVKNEQSCQKSGQMGYGSCDDVSTSVEQQDTKGERHIRSCSALPEISKLPDYDDLVARFSAIRKVH